MRKLAIVTDSASFLSKSYMEEHNIFLLPLNIVFENETFEEITGISEQDFYNKLKTEHPKTAQPSLNEMIELYERLRNEGYTDIYSIHCSGELSGSYNTSILAAKTADVTVHSIDSRIGSYPMAHIAEIIENGFNKGISHENIMTQVDNSINSSHLYFIPASLNQLKKSGRVSGSQALLSSLLNIKLICGFDKGKIILFDKTRSEKKAFQVIIDKLNNSINHYEIKEVAIIHCNLGEDELMKVSANLKSLFPNINFTPTSLSAAVGVHAGENTIGLSWIDTP